MPMWGSVWRASARPFGRHPSLTNTVIVRDGFDSRFWSGTWTLARCSRSLLRHSSLAQAVEEALVIGSPIRIIRQ